MGHKVLFDGNGSGIIQVVGIGLFVPAEKHNEVMQKWEQAQAERDALAREVDAANDRIGELQNALVDDASAKVMLKEMSIGNEGINLTAEGNIFHIFCEAFVKAFQESTAKNYLVMEFFNSELGPFTVTMQRSNGLTVHQKLKASEAERDALAAQVEALRSAIEPFATGGVCSAINREDYSIMRERIKDWHGVIEFKKAQDAYNSTPQQCLRDVQSEAIDNATTYLAESIPDKSYESVIFKDRYVYISTRYLREYAAKLRQGGAE